MIPIIRWELLVWLHPSELCTFVLLLKSDFKALLFLRDHHCCTAAFFWQDFSSKKTCVLHSLKSLYAIQLLFCLLEQNLMHRFACGTVTSGLSDVVLEATGPIFTTCYSMCYKKHFVSLWIGNEMAPFNLKSQFDLRRFLKINALLGNWSTAGRWIIAVSWLTWRSPQ